MSDGSFRGASDSKMATPTPVLKCLIMEKKKLSILLQKARGTYLRNQQIRKLYQEGENMAQIGRMFKLKRQTIRHIVGEAE